MTPEMFEDWKRFDNQCRRIRAEIDAEFATKRLREFKVKRALLWVSRIVFLGITFGIITIHMGPEVALIFAGLIASFCGMVLLS